MARGILSILRSASQQKDLKELGPAERAKLVLVDRDGRLAFRHPLTRSAVVELSTIEERSEAHRALALQADPERRAWHLAEATVGPDEEVAALLEVARTRSCDGATRPRRSPASCALPRSVLQRSTGAAGWRRQRTSAPTSWVISKRTRVTRRGARERPRPCWVAARGDGRGLPLAQRGGRCRHRPPAAGRCHRDSRGPE